MSHVIDKLIQKIAAMSLSTRSPETRRGSNLLPAGVIASEAKQSSTRSPDKRSAIREPNAPAQSVADSPPLSPRGRGAGGEGVNRHSRESTNPIPSPRHSRESGNPVPDKGVGERVPASHPSPMFFGHRVFRAIAAVAIAGMMNLTVHPLVMAMNAPKPVHPAAWSITDTSADRQLMYLIDDIRATLMSPPDSVMRKEFDPKAALQRFDTLTQTIRASMDAERKAATAANTIDTARLDTLKQQFDARSQTFRSKLQDMVPQGILTKTAKSNGADLLQWLDEVSPLKAPEDFSEMSFQTLKPNRNNVPRDFENNPPLPTVGEGLGERGQKTAPPLKAGEVLTETGQDDRVISRSLHTPASPRETDNLSTPATNPPLPIVGEGQGERGLELFAKNASFTDAQYRASRAEAEITADIRARATALGNNPLNIYNWVRNNIEWQPTWGGQQTADMTLDVRRGNAMDIATLTIALLRAANVPARYVHGTVDVPVAQFMNMAGDFANIEAAWDFASAGGIPITGITVGGQRTSLRMEHVWVEAALPYFPSQGARPVSANNPIDTWVPIDPSFKQYDYLQGLDTAAIVDIDGEQLAENFINSGTVNEQEGWVQGLSSTIIEQAQQQAQQKLEAHIESMQNPTVGDVIGGRTIKPRTYDAFPSGLPYPRMARGVAYSELPDSLRVRVSLGLGWDRFDQDYLQSRTMPLYQLNQRNLTISFKPATTADEEALKALIPEDLTDPSQLPNFLPSSIRVIPEIKRDNEVLLTSSTSLALGEEIDMGYQFITPTQRYLDRRDSIIAGSYLALGIVGSNPSAKTFNALKANLEQTKQILETGTEAQKETLTRERVLGDMFAVGVQGYYAQYIAQSKVMSLRTSTTYHAIPTAGTFGYEPHQRTLLGVNRGIEAHGFYMNVRSAQMITDRNGDNEKAKQLMLQVGLLGSKLEHAVPERMFTDPNSATKPEGFSTAKALGMAVQQGQRIYTITQQNQAQALPNLRLDAAAMTEIRAALAAGKEVIAHADQLTVPGFRGSGYAITDPVTGEGLYKISGGKNGGFLTGLLFGASVVPILYCSMILIISGGVLGGVAGFAATAAVVALTIAAAITNVMQAYDSMDREVQKCFVGGFLTGLGLMGTVGGIGALLGADMLASVLLILGGILGTSIPFFEEEASYTSCFR